MRVGGAMCVSACECVCSGMWGMGMYRGDALERVRVRVCAIELTGQCEDGEAYRGTIYCLKAVHVLYSEVGRETLVYACLW